jgi:hypothetical protein
MLLLDKRHSFIFSRQMTRVLAEEQFMKRALIEKIQAGLAPGGTGARFFS